MALDLKVGSFLTLAESLTQVVTGVGFTPKLLIFWTQQSTIVAGETERFGRINVGFSDGTDERSVAVNSGRNFPFGVALTNTHRTVSSTALHALTGGSTVFAWHFKVDSLDADGFTIEYRDDLDISSEVNVGQESHVFYMALGGTDVENISIGSFDGDQGVPRQAITGLGFKPDFLMTIGAGSPAGSDFSLDRIDNASFSLGMSTAVNQYCTGIKALHGLPLSNTISTIREEFISLFSDNLALIEAQATLRTMDTDGFTLDWQHSVVSYRYFYLAVKGPRFRVGTETTPIAPTKKSVLGTGFLPKGVISLANGVLPTLPSLTGGISYAFGGADATSSFVTAYSDPNGRIPETAQRERQDALTLIQTNSGFNRAIGKLFEFAVDGFTIDWTIADPPTLRFCYMAVGPKVNITGSTLIRDNVIQLTDVGSVVSARTTVQSLVWSDIAAKGDRLRIGESAALGSASNLLLSASATGTESTIIFPFNDFVFRKGLQITALDSGKVFIYTKLSSQTPLLVTLVDAGDLTLISAPGAGLSIYVTALAFSGAGGGNNVVSFREGLADTYRLRAFLQANGTSMGREVFSPPWKLPVNTALVGNLSDSTPDVYVTIQYFIAP